MATRYAHDFSIPVRLGLLEHIVSGSSGGTDTAALSSTELKYRGLNINQVGQVEIKLGPRKFVLGRAAANTAVGPALLVSADFSANCIAEFDNPTVSGGTAGSQSLTLTSASLSAVTKDQFINGFLNTTDDAGEGFMYAIKSNTVASTNAVTFSLYDPIAVAMTTATTDFSIIGNPYDHLVNATAATDNNVIGVCVADVNADGSGIYQYCWVQTAGPALIVADAAVAIAKGDILTLSSNHAGNVMQLGESDDTAEDLAAESLIGYAMDTPDDTGHCPVWLQLG